MLYYTFNLYTKHVTQIVGSITKDNLIIKWQLRIRIHNQFRKPACSIAISVLSLIKFMEEREAVCSRGAGFLRRPPSGCAAASGAPAGLLTDEGLSTIAAVEGDVVIPWFEAVKMLPLMSDQADGG